MLPLLSLPALSALAQGSLELAGLSRRGQARFRFFGLHIYDIRLWSREPVSAAQWATQPFVLEIEYARRLLGSEIAGRSLKEMRRQAAIADDQAQAWLAEMQAAFPDVSAGDRLSGQYEPGVAISFHFNGQLRRRIADPLFAQRFMGIWLSEQTSEPGLREQLLAAGDPR